MRKNALFMAVALVIGSTAFIACGGDEDEATPRDPEQPTPIEQPDDPEQPSLAGTYTGWTLGSNPYASYIPSDNDVLTITVTNAEGTLCDLTYTSETWGTATLRGVAVASTAEGYTFSKPVEATLRDDRSQWDFSAQVDSIAMPNRNPQAEAATVSNYPIVLTAGTMSADRTTWQFDFQAYLVARSGHIQNMSFRSGHIQPPQQ